MPQSDEVYKVLQDHLSKARWSKMLIYIYIYTTLGFIIPQCDWEELSSMGEQFRMYGITAYAT